MESKVLMCGHAYHTQRFHANQRLGLKHYLFRLQTEGMCSALVNGKLADIRQGDLLLYRPGDAYELVIDERHSNERDELPISSRDYFVSCSGDWVDQWWQSTARPQKSAIGADDRLITLWRQLIMEKRRFRHENEQLSALFLQSLCLLIDRALQETQIKPQYPYVVWKIKSYIDEHAVRQFKLHDVAAHAGLSVSRTTSLFRQCFGKTIVQYTLELRLALALERMAYSNVSLEHIAESCGFGSYTYFHRIFREKHHMSPGKFRRSMML